MKTIALCFSTPGMNELAYLAADYGRRYPGAGFMRHMNDRVGDPYLLLDGQRALQMFNKDASSVIVVQEENNCIGQELVDRGADPRALVCLESPIFASKFYDNIPMNFKHRLLFDGGTEHVYFPSFDEEDVHEIVSWNGKLCCMVMSNKHYSGLPKTDSRSFNGAMKAQLHDFRYQAVNHFLRVEGFDLFGRGWGDMAPECSNKIRTLRDYRFCLCFENGRYPGYITEKMIDCFVAGVVPVYVGAPDIGQYIPENCFIDGSKFASFSDMTDKMKSVSQDEWCHYVMAGRDFLRSSEGQKYNNRVFADRIFELCS